VITERGSQALCTFLSRQRDVRLSGATLRLLAIAFGVPQLVPVPLSEHNAPQFLVRRDKPWAFAFFHQTGMAHFFGSQACQSVSLTCRCFSHSFSFFARCGDEDKPVRSRG
jgi:hypothetical protein